MDAHVISIIVSFVPYHNHSRFRKALNGRIRSEDYQRIFHPPLHTIDILYLGDYLESLGYVRTKRRQRILDECLKHKLFVSSDTWDELLRDNCDGKPYKTMKTAMKEDREAWLKVNPFNKVVIGALGPEKVIPNCPLRYLPYLKENGIRTIVKHGKGQWTAEMVVKEFVKRNKHITELPFETSDELFKLYCMIARRGRWAWNIDEELIHRLILANNDGIYKGLVFDGTKKIDSYIIAHMIDVGQEITNDVIDDAPAELIVKAYRLWYQYRRNPR